MRKIDLVFHDGDSSDRIEVTATRDYFIIRQAEAVVALPWELVPSIVAMMEKPGGITA